MVGFVDDMYVGRAVGSMEGFAVTSFELGSNVGFIDGCVDT